MPKTKALYSLVFIKLFFVFGSFFLPFSLPHTVRQTDTMGVSFRYLHRWSLEKDFSLLPAVLNSGKGQGIQAMELPVLNILTAPSFVFGIDLGRVVARFALFFIVTGFTFLAYRWWEEKKIMEVEVRQGFFLLPIVGVTAIYFHRFMPDYLAFGFVLCSMGVLFQNIKTRYLWGFFFSAIGMMIKPPVVIAFAPLLLLLSPKQLTKSILFSLGPAFLVTVLYYTLGVDYLRSLSNMEPYFATSLRSPFATVPEYALAISEQLSFYTKNLFGRFVSILLLVFWIKSSFEKKKILLHPAFYLLLLQILAVAMMGGKPTLIHDYYFIGTSLLTCLFVLRFWEMASGSWRVALFMLLLGGGIDRGVYEIKNPYVHNIWAECRDIKNQNSMIPWKQNYVFASTDKTDPLVGLCFGERVGDLSIESDFILSFTNQSFKIVRK